MYFFSPWILFLLDILFYNSWVISREENGGPLLLKSLFSSFEIKKIQLQNVIGL